MSSLKKNRLKRVNLASNKFKYYYRGEICPYLIGNILRF